MAQISPAQIVVILMTTLVLGFWGLMFYDMTTNDDLPKDAKNVWAIAFVVLSLFTAAYYYVNVYIYRHRR